MVNKINSGNLTPRSNDAVGEMMFSGGFGQPDGFGSVLRARINRAGELALNLDYRRGISGPDDVQCWCVNLTNEQRKELAKFLVTYEPTLFENVVLRP